MLLNNASSVFYVKYAVVSHLEYYVTAIDTIIEKRKMMF